MKKHKLHYSGCVYNILGTNPNNQIGIKKISVSNTVKTYKPTVRVRTKAIKTTANRTGRRFN